MKSKEIGSSRVAFMATITVIGSVILVIFSDQVPGLWQILAWGGVCLCAVLVGVFHHKAKKAKIRLEKEQQKIRRQRSEAMQQEKLEQEKRIEASKEKMALQEAKRAEKMREVKMEMVKDAEVVWGGRVDQAKQKEDIFREIIKKTNQMPVRTAAGEVAFEWNEASRIAQWTMQQIMMFVNRPDVTTAAREEAQDAIIEAIKIKESGGTWTKENGQELAKKKEEAREELKVEEERLETIKREIEKANLKYKSAEKRASQRQSELSKIYKNPDIDG